MPVYCRLSLNTMTISVGTINVNTGHGVAISVTGIAQVLVPRPSVVLTPQPSQL